MIRFLTLIAAMLVIAGHPSTFARGLSQVEGQAPVDLKANIDRLAAFDYPVRSSAARAVRRATAADAVAALTDAVRNHRDGFVRYRALILLTAFNDPSTANIMR